MEDITKSNKKQVEIKDIYKKMMGKGYFIWLRDRDSERWFFKQRRGFFGGAFPTILARLCRYKYYAPKVL